MLRQRLRNVWYLFRGKFGERLAEKYAKLSIHYGRGKNLLGIPLDFYDLFVRLSMGGLAMDWLFNWKIPKELVFILVIIIPLLYILIAFIDKRYLHFWSFENKYQLENKDINPYFERKFEEIMNEIKKIKVK